MPCLLLRFRLQLFPLSRCQTSNQASRRPHRDKFDPVKWTGGGLGSKNRTHWELGRSSRDLPCRGPEPQVPSTELQPSARLGWAGREFLVAFL